MFILLFIFTFLPLCLHWNVLAFDKKYSHLQTHKKYTVFKKTGVCYLLAICNIAFKVPLNM